MTARHRELATVGALILANLPWLSTVAPPAVWIAYVAAELGLYALLSFARHRVMPDLGRAIERGLLVCIGLAVVAQLVVLEIVRPRVRIAMDRDSALLTWLASFARGEFPYTHPTELGNPISAFPLVPALAFPFAALGNIGYFEIAGYVVLAGLLWGRYRGRLFAQAFSILALSTAPLVYLEVLTRSELIANAALLMLLLVFVEQHEQSLGKPRTMAMVGFGLGCLMSTRLGFFPAFGVLCLYLLRRLPLASFAMVLGIAVATCAVIVVPFFVWNPTIFATYAPLGVNIGKLQVSPLAGTLWPAATVLTALVAGLLARRAADVFPGVAAVMLVVTLGTYLSSFIDVSYFQLSFVPLLFSFPRSPDR
jgi:hypothetical protein